MTSKRPSGPTMEFNVHFQTGKKGSKQLKRGKKPAARDIEDGRVPRVTKLMALAIRLDHLVHTGQVKNYAEIARLGHVTRARITQIMNLLCLAPSIQVEILDHPRIQGGRDPITERDLRSICAMPDWREQRLAWRALPPGREESQTNDQQ